MTLDVQIADPGVVSLITASSHTFVEIYHEIISTVILLLLLVQEGLLSVTSDSMCSEYSKTCVKLPFKNKQNKDHNDKW